MGGREKKGGKRKEGGEEKVGGREGGEGGRKREEEGRGRQEKVEGKRWMGGPEEETGGRVSSAQLKCGGQFTEWFIEPYPTKRKLRA